jgi:hypothetical protein
MTVINKLAGIKTMAKGIGQAFTTCFHVNYKGLALLAFLFPLNSFAQSTNWSEEMTVQLEKMGMLHIRVLEIDKHKVIGLEQGRYRFAPKGLAKVFEFIVPKAEADDTLSILLFSKGLPLLNIQSINGQMSRPTWEKGIFYQRLKGISPRQPASGRLEILVGPALRYQLGNLDFPVQAAVDLQTGWEYLIRPGLSFQGIIAWPVFNNYDEKIKPRLERAVLVHDYAHKGRLFASMAAGFFSLNRVGAHFSGRSWLPDERFSLRLDAGVTRFSGLTGPIRFDNNERKWTPLLIGGFEYHMRKYALTIRLSGGRFLYDDEGIMLEAFRNMGEYKIGFFASATSVGKNLGFQWAMPLFPARYSRPGRIRLRTANPFPLNYRYSGLNRDGRMYQTGNLLSEQLYGFYPQFFMDAME